MNESVTIFPVEMAEVGTAEGPELLAAFKAKLNAQQMIKLTSQKQYEYSRSTGMLGFARPTNLLAFPNLPSCQKMVVMHGPV